tara:strand:- start:1433 stop:1705 length:273 start_codon:yes stop_codon:yes gene_type:complete
MNYNNFRVLGKTFSSFSLKRHLHDRKLPAVRIYGYRNTKIVNWIGVESPKKADYDNYVIKTKQWTSRDIDCKAEYDDEFFKDENPNWRED